MQRVARWVIALEPLLVAIIVVTFWVSDYHRIWSILLLVPVIAARYTVEGRLWSPTPVGPFLLAFIALGVLNIYFAPFPSYVDLAVPTQPQWSIQIHWGWVMLGRVLMGLALFSTLVETARRRGRMDGIYQATVLLALLIAFIALTMSQWNSKAYQLQFIIGLLPIMSNFPGAGGGFNANEIAGALVWLIPLCAALAVYRWRSRLSRMDVTVAFCLLLLAAFLGQSRFGLAGIILALALVIWLMIPRGKWQTAAFVALALFTALEVAVFTNTFAPAQAETMQNRDESSFGRRLHMWSAAITIVQDYPLTGAGMNMYRAVRTLYPVIGYENRVLPHAHNELFQIASDMGVPGLLLFLAWHVSLVVMVVRCWRSGGAQAKAVSVGVGAGLLAHAFYGLGDAIPLWDRLIFVYWWLVGLLGGQYVLLRQATSQPSTNGVREPVSDEAQNLPMPGGVGRA